MVVADPAADHAAPVAALGDVAVIAQDIAHQGRDMPGHAPRADRRRRLVREGVAGQRRRHDMEGRGLRRAVGGGVGQWPEQVLELDEGAGPAMDQQQGRRVRPRRAAMDIVQRQPAGVRPEMRQFVETGLRPRASRSPPASSGRIRAASPGPAPAPSRCRPSLPAREIRGRAAECGRACPWERRW